MPESQRSNAGASLIVGLAAAVILALGVGVLVYTRQPPSSLPASSASPESAVTAPSAAPVPASEAPAAAGAQDAPRPPVGQTTAQAPPAGSSRSGGGAKSGVAPASKGQAAPARSERPAPATGKPAEAAPPAPPPFTAQAMQRRVFVPSRTSSENVRGISKSLSGFDSRRATEVKLKRAPDIEGRIEFSTTPAKVKPGDKYHVRVLLINEGKRSIEIKEVEVVTTINRKLSSVMVKPLVKQVAPRQNEVIHELGGTWDKATTSFSVGVRVMSDRLDLYRNQLVWK
jgi:hypothetical protein